MTAYKIPYTGNLKWLPERTIFYCVHGSRCYGTSRPDSDWDYKGVTVPPREYRDGFVQRFEQAIWAEPEDATVFEIRKFFSLASDANPNILELLYVDPSDILVLSEEGRMLVEARDLFLSRKAFYTFRGYAVAQLKRIRGHRRWLLDPPDHKPTREEFGLPSETPIPTDQMDTVLAGIKKKMDSWEVDFGELSEASKIHIQEQVGVYLAELSIGADEKFASASRLLGYANDFISMLIKEKTYRGALIEWKQYEEWRTNRNEKRAALEAAYGFDCYLDDTEFLTERGWLRYDEVKPEDRLGTLNQTTGQIEYQHYTERVEKPYDGKIGVLHPRHSNCAVTLNHRMWVSPARRGPHNGFSTAYTPEGAEWGIQRLADLVEGQRSYFHVCLAGEPSMVDSVVPDDYLTLMGAYVSEGCVGKRLTDGSASVVRISQKAGGRLEPIMEAWREAHPDVTRRFESLHDEATRTEPCLEIIWTVADREWSHRLERECGSGSLNKRLPLWVRFLSRRQVEVLLSAMIAGDGSERKFSRIYHTSSKRLADDVQAMCVHAGIVSQVWGPFVAQNRPDDTPMYQVYIGQTVPVATVALREDGSPSFALEEVRGARIVCFTVPNEVLVTRRHGKVAIQGNTKHGMHLVRLLRMCREILTEGRCVTRRPDAAELLSIRDGAWSYDRLVGWADEEDAALAEIVGKSVLPNSPNRNKLDDLCREIVASVEAG